MDDQTKVNRTIGYCTNVHAGATLAQTKANIENYAAKVKQIVSPNEPMGIGWWLVLFPGLILTFTLIAFNYIGDGLRDALDPQIE